MLFKGLMDILLPKRCVHCLDVVPDEVPLCLKCFHHLPETGWELDQANEAFKRLSKIADIRGVFSMWFYSHHWVTGSLIRALKYKNQPQIGAFIAKIVWHRVQHFLDNRTYSGIIPVPLHPKKLSKRGYNQLEEFCKNISNFSGVPYHPEILGVRKFKPSQTKLHQLERFQNRKQLFYLKDALTKGNYLLVDDIITTGATIAACCEVLQTAPDIKISIVSFAYSV